MSMLLLSWLRLGTLLTGVSGFVVPSTLPFRHLEKQMSSSLIATSFYPSSPSHGGTVYQRRHIRTRSSSLCMVFDRMSEDCIAAIVTAQTQAKRLGLTQVPNECMLLGVIDHPEYMACERTLTQYGITWRRILKGVEAQYQYGPATIINNSWLSISDAKKKRNDNNDDDIAFSKPLRQTMVQAGKLATAMGSSTIHSPHLLLALLEYQMDAANPKQAKLNNEHNVNASAAVVTVNEQGQAISTCDALQIILQSVDPDLNALEVCSTLLRHWQAEQLEASSRSNGPELVASGSQGSSNSKTPTLQEVGIDLTRMAQDGLLDPVHGRDREIQSSLRTLIRRRKNNVCLIGEAGVGKVTKRKQVTCIFFMKKSKNFSLSFLYKLAQHSAS